MKNAFMTLAMALLSCAPLMAQTTAPAAPAVPTALADTNFTYLTEARPAADAKFYIYLCSASWCGPCRAVMPRIVAQYPEIKAAGGEIVLLCFDRTPEAGKAYLKQYKASFPAILSGFREMMAMEKKLPGFKSPRGIPHAVFVTPDGKTISSGHGAITLNWQALISQAK